MEICHYTLKEFNEFFFFISEDRLNVQLVFILAPISIVGVLIAILVIFGIRKYTYCKIRNCGSSTADQKKLLRFNI